MLKKHHIRISGRKKSELQNTPGEVVRDNIIKAGYAAGNKTEVLVELAQKAGGGTALVGGSESGAALGRIGFKATQDMAHSNTVCTGLCLVSGTCKAVALGCSTIKVIPFRGRIYVGAKIISRSYFGDKRRRL